MSIVQIFDQTAPYVSGYSMRSLYLTNALHQLGLDVKAVRSPIFPYKQNEETIQGVPYYSTVMSAFERIRKFSFLKEALVIRALKNRLGSLDLNDATLLDAHSSVLNGIAAGSIARKRKIPFIYEVRALWEDAAVDQGKTKEGSPRYLLTRKIETDVIRRADKITVICEGLREDILRRGIPTDKISVIQNGVDTEEFQPPAGRDTEIVDTYSLKDVKVIGFVGTFFQFEGLEILIRAAENIIRRAPHVKFLLVGGGREEANLKKLTAELKLNEHVIFSGRVKHEDVKKFYSVIDILVYPRISLRITELVTPLKPLEAMAMEKIVIGSDVGGLKELITPQPEKVNGLLFKAGDVDDLVEKCLYALTHTQDVDALRKQAREWVVKERNWLTICRRYLDIFCSLGVSV